MDDDPTTIILKLGAVLLLVLLNGFFVAAEFALVSVRSTRIDQLIEQGNRMARLVRRAQQDPNYFISACQVGITMASLGLGWIAEPALASVIDPPLERLLGHDARISSHLIAGVFAYFLITLLHIVIGEQVPKMIALQRSEATILASAGPVTWIAIPFRPLIALLYWLTAVVLKLLGLKWEGEHSLVYSSDELKMLVAASHERGILEESEQEMIVRALGFADVESEEVMMPRTEIIAIQADATLQETTHVVSTTGHARYPVYNDNIDDIIGVFHTKDLYKLLERDALKQFNLRRMVRAPLMIPGAMPIDDLLAAMKRQRTHVAIVVDEYGGTAGMVTFEDILERIVGEIHDEFETGAEDIQEMGNGEARISGLLTIDEVNERFRLKIDDPIYNTIGGHVFGQLGRRPEIGDEIRSNHHILRVAALDGLRIDRLLLIPAEQPAEGDIADEPIIET